jgi:hypothetical protein
MDGSELSKISYDIVNSDKINKSSIKSSNFPK